MRKQVAIRILALGLSAAVLTPQAVAMAAEAETQESAEDKSGEEEKKEEKEEKKEPEKKEESAAAETTEAAPAPAVEPDQGSSSMAEALQTQRTMVADDDIMMLRIGYMFDDGSFDEWQRGTGFVVGNRYILTRQIMADCTTQNALYQKILKERGESYKRIGVNLTNEDDTQAHIRCLITDIEGKDIAISDITVKSGLALVVTKDVMEMPAVVFANAKAVDLSEGTVINVKSVGSANDRCVVNTFQGKVVVKEGQESGYAFNATGDPAFPVGAPAYDKNGHILGMVSGDGTPLTCFTINSLETFLTTNGVKYRTIEQIEAESSIYDQKTSESDINQAESVVADKEALEALIDKAQAANEKDYTAESYAAMQEVLETAIRIDANMEVSQQEVDAAAEKLEEAYNALESKGFFKTLMRKLSSVNKKKIAVIAGAIAAVIALLAILGKKVPALKKKENNSDRKKEASGGDDDEMDITKRPGGTAKRKPGDYDDGIDYMDEAEHDGFLDDDDDDGSDDTQLLKKEAYLVREENGKMIGITKNNFTIGKERKKVDYCISGNPTVSRHHCTIRMIGDMYYIEDNDSANYTFVNGKRLKPYGNAHIEDGDKIRLSNVDFVFHTK